MSRYPLSTTRKGAGTYISRWEQDRDCGRDGQTPPSGAAAPVDVYATPHEGKRGVVNPPWACALIPKPFRNKRFSPEASGNSKRNLQGRSLEGLRGIRSSVVPTLNIKRKCGNMARKEKMWHNPDTRNGDFPFEFNGVTYIIGSNSIPMTERRFVLQQGCELETYLHCHLFACLVFISISVYQNIVERKWLCFHIDINNIFIHTSAGMYDS
ncbi:hypothetical protein AVEN_177241-1 [Araneus ventricosus]|uniref:Uncharacterized protein n=1 Tax=Araneus ventricosus TaxID=182803 RepID=A0A4Y2J6J2_ARAVE|nr:hypothetical protein AVEN_177241-1 [Araneus ventricosus]